MCKSSTLFDPQFLVSAVEDLREWIFRAPSGSHSLFPSPQTFFKFNSISYSFITNSTGCFLFFSFFTVSYFFLTAKAIALESTLGWIRLSDCNIPSKNYCSLQKKKYERHLRHVCAQLFLSISLKSDWSNFSLICY